MLRGIDISSHQGDINLSPLPIDFVIVKATEGVGYVNPYCDKKVQQAIGLNKLWGFYHYGKSNEPEKEAQYFIDNCLNYFYHGIPILDWEENQSVDWVNRFVRYVHNKTGIWCWIYANPWRFNQGGVEANCGRWIASYPNVIHPDLNYDPGKVPKTDGLVCAWQYASDGRIAGYNGNLDLNHFFGDAAAWHAYAGIKVNPTPPTNETPNKQTSILENEEYKVTIERK